MYIVTVEFTLKPERIAAFMPLMVENARASREREPGCRQFDVCVDPEAPHVVFLYEVYDDRAAFDAHIASAHFKNFDAAVADMVAEKKVRTYVSASLLPGDRWQAAGCARARRSRRAARESS